MLINVADLLARKGGGVLAIAPTARILEAARLMNEQRIGSLVVMEGPRLVGIVTERDLLTRVVAQERSPRDSTVAEVMTTEVLTCTPATRLDEVRWLMRSRRIRHVPVVEGQRVVGMVSIGDLNLAEQQGLSETIQYLEAYITSGWA